MNTGKNSRLIKEYLKAQPDISAAYLFGSMAQGTSRTSSDIDMALLFTPGMQKMERFDRRLELGIELEKITHKEVDVIDMESAPPVLQHQIRKHGILLLEKDRRHRVNFEVASRRRYFDLLEVYKRRNTALFNRLGD